MKQFTRTALTDIKYNGVEYTPIYKPFLDKSERKMFIDTCEAKGIKVISVLVLSKNLKGKRDLHGNYYKPSEWLYISK